MGANVYAEFGQAVAEAIAEGARDAVPPAETWTVKRVSPLVIEFDGERLEEGDPDVTIVGTTDGLEVETGVAVIRDETNDYVVLLPGAAGFAVDMATQAELDAAVDALDDDLAALDGALDAETIARLAADSAEATARTNADAGLQSQITTEQTSRANADAGLQTQITANTSALAGKQPLDAELTALAGLTSAADLLPYFTGSGTMAATAFSPFARTLLDDTTQASMRATLGLVPGSDVQAYSTTLAGLAAAGSSANKFPVYNGAGSAFLADITAAARGLLDDVDVSAMLTTLGVSTFVKTLLDDATAAAFRTTLGIDSDDVVAFGEVQTTGSIRLGAVGPALKQALLFGLDVNIYRDAADLLKTDDDFDARALSQGGVPVNSRVGRRTLTGIVNTAGAGSIVAGSGFTITRNGTGDVTINITTPFTAAPAPLANVLRTATEQGVYPKAAPAAGSVRFQVVNDASAAAEGTFYFELSATDGESMQDAANKSGFLHKSFTTFNPQDLIGTFKNAPDGTQTFTLPFDGVFKLTASDRWAHANNFDYETTQWVIGGTATRLDGSGGFVSGQTGAANAQDRSDSHVAYFQGTKGQTITFLPSARLAASTGTVGQHSAIFNATVELIGLSSVPFAPMRCTTLPQNPFDGQEVIFVADAANGIEWHLRYDASLTGSYKWAFIGGPPLRSSVQAIAGESCAGDGVQRDLATVGPSITLPLAGDYEYDFGANAFFPSTLAHSFAQVILTDGANAALDGGNDHFSQVVMLNFTNTNTSPRGEPKKTGTLTSRPVGSAVKMRYQSSDATHSYRLRVLRLRPVRVG